MASRDLDLSADAVFSPERAAATQHLNTPGPWGQSGGLVGTLVEGRREWTHVASIGPSGDDAEDEANANLIAAAPDLRDALIDTITAFSADIDDSFVRNGRAALARARAALARAAGGALEAPSADDGNANVLNPIPISGTAEAGIWKEEGK